MKVGLVCGLVALGALNHFATVPALCRDEDAVRPLRRTVSGEIVLGATVLAVTAVLGGLAARAAASSRVVLSGADYATTVRVRLVVDPGTVGRNSFTATLTDYASGRALTGVRSVELDLSLPGQTTVQPSSISLAEGAGGIWQGSAFAPSVEGRWSIQVLIQETTTAVVVPLTMQARLPAS